MLHLRDVLSELKRTGDFLVTRDSASEKAAALAAAQKPRHSIIGLSWNKQEETNTAKREAKIKEIVTLIEGLDVNLANRQFEEAVTVVEKARAKLSVLGSKEGDEVTEVQSNLKTRVEKLSTTIERDFKNPVTTKGQLEQSIEWLVRLELYEEASERFLSARTVIIRQRVNQVLFDGNVFQYIKELAVVIFTMIRNTTRWYIKSFQKASMCSAFMKWVKHEIDYFAELFRRRVFFEPQSFHVIALCLQCAIEQCEIMKEAGLDMAFLLERLFYRNISEAIDVYVRICIDAFTRSWAGMENKPIVLTTDNDSKYNVSKECENFYHTVVDFQSDLTLISDSSLYEKTVTSVSSLVEGFVKSITKLVERNIDNERFYILSGDMRFIVEYLIPYLSAQLSDFFGRPIQELHQLKKNITVSHQTILKQFGVNKGRELLIEFNFDFKAYSEEDGDFGIPSQRMQKLIRSSHALALPLKNFANERGAAVTSILETIFSSISEVTLWENASGPRQFGYAGVQQLVLDIHFLHKVCDPYISDNVAHAANNLCEKALKAYFASGKGTGKQLQTGEWYNEKVAAAIESLGPEFSKFGE